MQKLNPSLVHLVKLLNNGEYHDGTTLGDTLSITRSAVWKSIKKLIHYGIPIESVKGKGYLLREPLSLLDPQAILEKTRPLDLRLFESIDSTNQYLKKFFHHPATIICLAEQQTLGKGRLQRTWHSPFGQNIYFSCLYHFNADISELSGLSLVIGLAVTKAIYLFSGVQCHVKWPNDVIFNHKKISGNLIEVQAESHGATHTIIGIGINVNMIDDTQSIITQQWTSLRHITHEIYDRNILCATLINTLFTYLERFEKNGLTDFINEWNQTDYLFNQPTALVHANTQLSGIGRGINQYGHLVLTCSDGTTKVFSSGDTHILKHQT
jgi:BirA family transcriptional regulator, biotin operon repressor / biotin---[acetyl-CoA-carboxylase] ligase